MNYLKTPAIYWHYIQPVSGKWARIENSLNNTTNEDRNTRMKTCLSVNFSTTNFKWTDRVIKPKLLGKIWQLTAVSTYILFHTCSVEGFLCNIITCPPRPTLLQVSKGKKGAVGNSFSWQYVDDQVLWVKISCGLVIEYQIFGVHPHNKSDERIWRVA